MTNATHSHDAAYPEDDWNLYSMLDATLTKALNVTRPDDTIGLFKPFVRRLLPAPVLISDADEEIIVNARFTSPVHIRKIMVVGGGESEAESAAAAATTGVHHPNKLKCYVNHENIDFTSIEATRCAQEFDLPINASGTVELLVNVSAFTNVTMLTFYFPSNHGQEANTILKYIGMQGEHTHYRREAVDATYEVLCNGQDIQQPEDAKGAHASHLH